MCSSDLINGVLLINDPGQLLTAVHGQLADKVKPGRAEGIGVRPVFRNGDHGKTVFNDPAAEGLIVLKVDSDANAEQILHSFSVLIVFCPELGTGGGGGFGSGKQPVVEAAFFKAIGEPCGNAADDGVGNGLKILLQIWIFHGWIPSFM